MNETKRPSLRGIVPSLTVDDVHDSLYFYETVLGFDAVERFEHEGELMGVVLRWEGHDLMLVQDDWKKGRERDKGTGIRHYLIVEGTDAEIDGLAAGFEARGATLSQQPTSQPWGTRDFALADPSGYLLTFTTDWEQAGEDE